MIPDAAAQPPLRRWLQRLPLRLPQTLLARTFLLISLLLFGSVAAWLTLFSLAEREPRARQLGQLAVSVVNLTTAALVAADPINRLTLLQDLADKEGVHLYPAEASDSVTPLPDSYFFQIMRRTTLSQLGPKTRLASDVNGEPGLWISFTIEDANDEDDDEYWLRLPSEHAVSRLPWHWLGWGCASLFMALVVAWLIVSRVTQPLRHLAAVARAVGRGKYPPPLPERGASELQELTGAFNRMAESLQHIDAERAEVLAGISHDLRTPLARLRLEAEMSISDDDARHGIADDIDQMDAIIAQFLDYARSNGEETPERVDINVLVSQAACTQGRAAKPPRLSQQELPKTLIRRQALTRAITNLLDNARKYGSSDGNGEIEVETRLENGEIVIDVADRGPGIPESERERLKRPFTRLENARTNATGTGLGLAIVERVAGLHQGRFELLAREGGGLIARLRLPIVTAPAAAPADGADG